MKIIKRFAATMAVSMALGVGVTTVEPPIQATATKRVYIAPSYGTKYHFKKHCRGLNRAKSKKKVTYKWAKKHGYTKCKWG